MPEDKFQREVLDRLIRIETKQDEMIKTVDDHSDSVKQHDKDIVRLDASTKSAHHRLDGIFAAAGIIGGVAGYITQLVVNLWPKGGGHG